MDYVDMKPTRRGTRNHGNPTAEVEGDISPSMHGSARLQDHEIRQEVVFQPTGSSNTRAFTPEDLFSPSRSVMLGGLRVRADLSPDGSTLRAVYEAAKNYETGPLPAGVSEELFRFVCVSAGWQLWEGLERQLPAVSSVLIGYYLRGVPLRRLKALAGGISLGSVWNLVQDTTHMLWQHLPATPSVLFPIDKAVAFPLECLRKSRKGLGSQAMRKQWESQHDERAARVAAGAKSQAARSRKSEALKRAWADPSVRATHIEAARRRFEDPDRRAKALAQVQEASNARKAVHNQRASATVKGE